MSDKASAVADLATIARQTVVSPERRTRIDADHPLPTEPAADGGIPRLELYNIVNEFDVRECRWSIKNYLAAPAGNALLRSCDG